MVLAPLTPCFQSFSAITWPHPTPVLTRATFTEVDGLWQTTLCTSQLTGLGTEVLILGLALGEEDSKVSTPAKETVTVGTTPLITTRGEQDGALQLTEGYLHPPH